MASPRTRKVLGEVRLANENTVSSSTDWQLFAVSRFYRMVDWVDFFRFRNVLNVELTIRSGHLSPMVFGFV